MKKIISFSFAMMMMLVASAANHTVTFQVNMKGVKNFKAASVFIRGNIAPLNWEKNIALSDEDQDGIFSITLTFDTDKTVEYKYLYNENWESLNNRSLDLSKTTTTDDTWNRNFSVQPYTFKKDGQTLDFATRMKSEQVVHGVSQIIMHKGKIDTLFTWGFRDVDSQLPVDANTLFHIGGMGQSITAFTLLVAVEKGKINLEQPINNYLKNNKLEGDFTVKDVMIGKLNVNGQTKPDGYAIGEKIPSLQDIFDGKNTNTPKMKQKKGENKEPLFNIFSALLIQQVLEDTYGQSFEKIVQDEVLTPLEMKNTIVAAQLSEKNCVNASVGYLKNGKAVAGKRLIFPELGFGGVWTTPSDYAKFLTYMMKAYRGEDNRLVSQNLAKAALQAQNDFRALVFPRGDESNYFGGAATGFRTQCAFDAENDWLMVTFMNSYENWRVMLDIEQSSKSLIYEK